MSVADYSDFEATKILDIFTADIKTDQLRRLYKKKVKLKLETFLSF